MRRKDERRKSRREVFSQRFSVQLASLIWFSSIGRPASVLFGGVPVSLGT